ncbi:MAG: hypothetical protein SVJ22_03385 [Halobacteriota archaeon]|nr:hypothetical protein [Halobacteriota archaeon]
MAGYPNYQPPYPPMGAAPPTTGGAFDSDESQLQMFGMLAGMLFNTADEQYREALRDVDGSTILVDFGDMGSMVIKVNGNTVEAFTGTLDDPTLKVDVKAAPNDLIDMLAPALAPIIGPVMPYAMPLISEGITVRRILKLVVNIIPELPSMVPTVRLVVGGIMKRKLIIKGSIAPVLPLLEVFLIPFLTGEEDPEWMAERARTMKEFETGPPDGWGI